MYPSSLSSSAKDYCKTTKTTHNQDMTDDDTFVLEREFSRHLARGTKPIVSEQHSHNSKPAPPTFKRDLTSIKVRIDSISNYFFSRPSLLQSLGISDELVNNILETSKSAGTN